MDLQITKQNSKALQWKDEKGVLIPYSRTTKTERLKEHRSATLLARAIKINEQLIDFKKKMEAICQEVYDTYMEEVGNTKHDKKGNFVWYNFDRSIKIQIKINDRIDFDDLSIQACKDKLDEFLNDNVESKDQFIKQMVLDAFETSRGKLDAKKVMGLLRYKSKVKNDTFQKAMSFLEDSIRRPDSRAYFQIWGRDERGDYKYIDLNFSSVKS